MSLGHREFILSEDFSAAFNSSDIINDGWPGVIVSVDVDAISAGSITVNIEGRLPDGNYYNILSSAAISSTGVTVLRVHPAIVETANVAASDLLPNKWRITVAGSPTGLTATATYVYAT